MATYTTLIDAQVLVQAQNVKLLDCRALLGDPDHGERVYTEAHLPGARYLNLDTDLADPPGPGGRHPLPQPDRLAERLRALGINNADQVVVYDDAGGAYAARAWWCLRWLGHDAVAVLDGGMQAWDGPTEADTDSCEPGDFSIRPSLTRSITADQLLATLGDTRLIDARSQARFAGREEPIDPVAGHIPGAECLPFQGNLTPTGTFASASDLQRRFGTADQGADTICYCGSGVTAAHNILALKIAGFSEPILYPGSWSEWLLSSERPVAKGD